MLARITNAQAVGEFELELWFSDGTVGVVDLRRWIVGHGGVFGPLNDPAVFRQVRVDLEAGTVVWPNGADLCPDVLYSAIRPAATAEHDGR